METINKMELIRSTFQKGKEEGLQFVDFEGFDSFIKAIDKSLLPVLFEGTSAGIALNALEKNASLNLWNTFYNYYSRSYAKQLHVGLGWALNESNSSLNFLQNIQPQWRWRVMDGFGYYAGLFQRRKILRSRCVPSIIPREWHSAYLQGLGRSLWYLTGGNIDQLLSVVTHYPPTFEEDLWRGVGIAVAFVGEIKDESLFHLSTINSLKSLKQGAALAVSSMLQTGEFSTNTRQIGDYFFENYERVASFVGLIEERMNIEGDNYMETIKSLSLDFSL